VFKITSGGSFNTLHNFSFTDGSHPYAGLVQANDGNFYGTASNSGPSNAGTVFKITAGGSLTTVYSFNGIDGANPFAGLVQGSDSNFYGTTYGGGNNLLGTVFVLTGLLGPTNKDQCKNGGWQTFTAPRIFRNQGDCIQFVNTGR
jgi:uncharacterized repeat protein (TIGR03803 family)